MRRKDVVLLHFSLVLYFTLKQPFALHCKSCLFLYGMLHWAEMGFRREYSLLQILNLSLPKCFYGSFVNRYQNSSEDSKPFWRLCFGRGSIVCPPSNGKGLKDIQHSMSTVLDTRFHVWFITILYYKMRQLFYCKTRQKFITKCIRFFIIKCDSFITKWEL